jgi:hypothetical protein
MCQIVGLCFLYAVAAFGVHLKVPTPPSSISKTAIVAT